MSNKGKYSNYTNNLLNQNAPEVAKKTGNNSRKAKSVKFVQFEDELVSNSSANQSQYSQSHYSKK